MYYFSRKLDDRRILVLAPLSSRRLAMSGEEIPDQSGYFLFEQVGEENCASVSILAQVHSDEAALALKNMMQLD